MNIEIFTDASVNTQTGGGGFAHWIYCYQFEQQRAGYCGEIKNTAIGELFAVNDAVEVLLSRELVPFDRLEIFTDSTETIHKMKDTRYPYVFNLIELALKNGYRPHQVFDLIQLRHVKAHTKKDDMRSYKNRWCDTAAKQHRYSRGSFNAVIFDKSDILL